jgi:hypothetical protein
MILAFSFNNAHAQYQGNWDQGYNDYNSQQGVEETQSYVGQYMGQGQEIQLMQKLKLMQAIRQGKKVLSLKVAAQANAYNTKLVLKLNGQKIEAKLIGTNSYETVFAVPHLKQYDTLTLKVRGSAYIEKVTATLKTPYSGGGQGQGGINQNGVVKARIHQNTQGVHVHKVKQLVKSQNQVRLRGLKVKKVIMKASSR